jgi:hypothetical protein
MSGSVFPVSHEMSFMRIIFACMLIAGLFPLAAALLANRVTSLAHAILWMMAAWLSWGIALVLGNWHDVGMDAGRYCALCLTACAGVAVLNARRPYVGAWNFVVLGLFAVMVLPLLETMFIGTHPVDPLRIFFLSMTLAIGLLNYMPTRFGPAALCLMPFCAGEILLLYTPSVFTDEHVIGWMHGGLLTVPWIAWICAWLSRKERGEFDRLWLTFRDRWGLLWGQRVREQFNHAAQNAGWPVKLSWRGLARAAGQEPLTAIEEEKMLRALQAALQRFIPSKEQV